MANLLNTDFINQYKNIPSQAKTMGVAEALKYWDATGNTVGALNAEQKYELEVIYASVIQIEISNFHLMTLLSEQGSMEGKGTLKYTINTIPVSVAKGNPFVSPAIRTQKSFRGFITSNTVRQAPYYQENLQDYINSSGTKNLFNEFIGYVSKAVHSEIEMELAKSLSVNIPTTNIVYEDPVLNTDTFENFVLPQSVINLSNAIAKIKVLGLADQIAAIAQVLRGMNARNYTLLISPNFTNILSNTKGFRSFDNAGSNQVISGEYGVNVLGDVYGLQVTEWNYAVTAGFNWVLIPNKPYTPMGFFFTYDGLSVYEKVIGQPNTYVSNYEYRMGVGPKFPLTQALFASMGTKYAIGKGDFSTGTLASTSATVSGAFVIPAGNLITHYTGTFQVYNVNAEAAGPITTANVVFTQKVDGDGNPIAGSYDINQATLTGLTADSVYVCNLVITYNDTVNPAITNTVSSKGLTTSLQ